MIFANDTLNKVRDELIVFYQERAQYWIGQNEASIAEGALLDFQACQNLLKEWDDAGNINKNSLDWELDTCVRENLRATLEKHGVEGIFLD